MACISPRRGRWICNYRDATGKQRQPSFRTKREAETFLATAIQEQRQITVPVVDPDIKVAPYADRWLALIAPTLKPSTVVSYSQRLRVHVLPGFGSVKVRQIQRGRIKSFLSEKLASGLAPDSV